VDFASDKEDLLQIVDFFESLLKILVERVPDRRAQFRRVFYSDIQPRLQRLRSSLQSIKTDNDENWKKLHEHGLDGESLRFARRARSLATTVEGGDLGAGQGRCHPELELIHLWIAEDLRNRARGYQNALSALVRRNVLSENAREAPAQALSRIAAANPPIAKNRPYAWEQLASYSWETRRTASSISF
jgi:hypothetical protein